MKKDVMYTYKMDETGKVVDIIVAPAALYYETSERSRGVVEKGKRRCGRGCRGRENSPGRRLLVRRSYTVCTGQRINDHCSFV